MLNTILEWMSPVIGWISGLDMVAMARYTCGLLFIALACYAVMLKLANRDLRSDLAWWQDRYRSLTLTREEDNSQAFKDQQELRINLAKSQDSLSEACDKFNDHMARRDSRIRKLQDELDVTKKELACAKAAVKLSGRICASHIELLDYLDKHCNISVRDEKGRFSGRVTASGLYDAKFKHEIYKGEL